MNFDAGLRIAIALSFITHILLFSLLFLIPKKEVKKVEPFVARLVTPEEVQTKKGNAGVVRELPPGYGTAGKEVKKGKMPARQEPLKESQRIVKPEGTRKEMWQGKDLQPGSEGLREKETLDTGDSNRPGFSSQPPSVPATPEIKQTRPLPLLPKEGLFDREIVENLAKKQEKENTQDKGITFDTKELRYFSYMQRLKQRIEGIWIYPTDAAEKGIYGDLYIRFTIKKNGRLGNVELLRTSGYKSLDEAAIRALRDAAPFWPLPDEWGKDEIVITGHFIYSLYGTYIR